jgi:single-stranded DNA-binding protein
MPVFNRKTGFFAFSVFSHKEIGRRAVSPGGREMQDLNHVEIRGTVASEPVFRDTRNNSRMGSFSVSVRRKAPSSAKDYLDVIAWGETAVSMEGLFRPGDPVELDGYIRKQFYVDDKGERHSRCQIIAEHVIRPADLSEIPQDLREESYEEAAA